MLGHESVEDFLKLDARREVFAPGRKALPVPGLRRGRFLVSEYLALKGAMTAHLVENDQEKAYQMLGELHGLLAGWHRAPVTGCPGTFWAATYSIAVSFAKPGSYWRTR